MANNRDFLDWTLSDYNPQDDKPGFSIKMQDEFGWFIDNPPPNFPQPDPAPLITTVDEVKNAVVVLFWFRFEFGLEAYMPYRRLSSYDIPDYTEQWMMCSENTQGLGEIYEDKIPCCGDDRTNFDPLIDRISEWMDTFYGQ